MRGLCALAVLAGCSVTVRGAVIAEPPSTYIQELTGERTRLGLTGDARLLRFMNGDTIQVRGTQAFGRLRVSEWRVLESRNGLPVWIGRVEQRGMQLILKDHYADTWFIFEQNVVAELAPFIGMPVMVEGYIDGAHILRVVHYQVLVEGEE